MINIYICDFRSNKEIQHMVVRQNMTISALLDEVLDLPKDINVGIFGKLMDNSYTLKNNDRVEFYEKILVDPKIRRKKRVSK
tara:strand:- start:2903 stop:3148 length:246 start_codon:yes stop_codon:yes gene_type:complete